MKDGCMQKNYNISFTTENKPFIKHFISFWSITGGWASIGILTLYDVFFFSYKNVYDFRVLKKYVIQCSHPKTYYKTGNL